MNTLLASMEAYAAEHRVPIIGKDAAQLITGAILGKEIKSILEIGTAIGYSALLLADEMATDGHIWTIELDAKRAEVAEGFIRQSTYADAIHILVGDAAGIIPSLDQSFDLVFIDAAKSSYLKYLLLVIDKLRPGALIVADNVLFRGWVRGPEPPRRFRTIVRGLRQYLDFVTADPDFFTQIYPLGDGVAISCYKGAQIDEEN